MEISTHDLGALRQAADDARTLNYSPYSGFLVLAAARTVGGAIGGGSNVENVNFSLTKHAEEVAILGAMQAGGEPPRPGMLELVYVAGAVPCGGCRQFALEFGTTGSLWIIDALPQEMLRDVVLTELPPSTVTIMTFGAALPSAFETQTPGVRRIEEPAPRPTLR